MTPLPSEQNWTLLPPTTGDWGYLYVLQFDPPMVKVGRTCNPADRMTKHLGRAASYGSRLVSTWFSPAHVGYKANEDALIECAMRKRLGRRVRREYFLDADFDEAVRIAEAVVSGKAGSLFEASPLEIQLDLIVQILGVLDTLKSAALNIRDGAIAAAKEAESLSLGSVAERFGISKARADQITRERSGRQPYPSQRPGYPIMSHEDAVAQVRNGFAQIDELIASLRDARSRAA